MFDIFLSFYLNYTYKLSSFWFTFFYEDAPIDDFNY
jgi:hypothetical protein